MDTSSFPVDQGPQVNEQILIDPCEVDTRDGRLIAINADTGAISISAPPVPPIPGPSEGVFVGTWIGTWESIVPELVTVDSGNITLVITSEEESFPGSNSFDLTGFLTMTGKPTIDQLPVSSLASASLMFGFTLTGVPSGELSICGVPLATSDVFSPTRMAGVYIIDSLCQNTEVDGGLFEIQKQS